MFRFVCILVTEPEPECEFPEPVGNDYSDNDMPDMGEVSPIMSGQDDENMFILKCSI